ncbi:sigma-70 family RNA polymerase sigma factor [Flagellimonas sp. 2504JD4-2]
MDLQDFHNKLFPYAYNILGSSEDAKDVVQNVLTKYFTIDKQHIDNETGYLIKWVINSSINVKKRKNQLTVDRMWLPEPYSTENADDNINKEEILSYSLLVLLESLTAKERAVFILKEAFDYSHKEIAEAVDIAIENSRKLLSRARVKLGNYRTNATTNQQQSTSYLENYMKVIKNGDIMNLEKLLSQDILLAADGGESINVVRELTEGTKATSKLLLYVHKAFLEGLTFKIGVVNHQPAILFFKDEVLYNCQVFNLVENKVRNIYSIVDPVKLQSLSK